MLWRMITITARQQWNAVVQRGIQRRADRQPSRGMLPVQIGYALPETREFSIEGPGGEHRIFVAVPPAPPPPEGYPVLFLLDANACFGTAVDALRLQSPWPEVSGVKPMVIVGIGYPGEAAFDSRRRSLDLAPAIRNPTWRSSFVLGPPWNKPGGADAFLAFLSDTLIGDLARRYPVNPGDCHLCGLSLAGFFALYAMTRAPGVFRSHVGVSSALWWDDNRIAGDLERLESRDDPAARVLVVVGSTEIPDNPAVCEMMCQQNRRAVDILKDRGYRADYLELSGENHQSCITAAMPAILRFVSGA